MNRRCRLLIALVLAGFCVSAWPVRAGGLDEDRAEVRAGVVPALGKLAAWCHEKKLFASRNELAVTILKLDPAHTRSRVWLKYKLKAGGGWTAPKRRPRPSDRNAAALQVLPTKRAEIIGALAERYLDILDTHEETLTPGQRESVLQEALTLDPQNANVRLVHRDVRDGERWVMRETVTARKRRELIRQATKDALVKVGAPKRAEPRGLTPAYGTLWTCAFRTKYVLVFGSAEPDEARHIAKYSQAVPDLLAAALDLETRHFLDYRVFAVRGATQRKAFLSAHPGFDPEERARSMRFAGSWVPGKAHLVVSHSRADRRIDSAVNQLIGSFIYGKWGLESAKSPWATHGLRARLTWELTGTRYSFVRRVSEYAEQAADWMNYASSKDFDWYVGARKALEEGDETLLIDVIYRSLNEFQHQDAVIAHALVAYFIEGRPVESRKFFLRIGQGDAAVDALREEMDLDLQALRLRLIQWLKER